MLSRAGPDGAPAEPVSDAEAASLLCGLAAVPRLVLAVSGGPDSTALLVLVARWRAALPAPPAVLVATVNHGLRPGAAREAAAVKQLAKGFGLAHRTLRWRGAKPQAAVQAAAREARYALLAAAARRFRAIAVVTAHTRDDQAETVLFRLARGSGLGGLAGMAARSPFPCQGPHGQPLVLLRPLLDLPKARLTATLAAAGVPFAIDPANADPRFARARLRRLERALAAEGLDHARLAKLAGRARRAEQGLDWAVAQALQMLPAGCWSPRSVVLPLDAVRAWPDEILLRVLQRAVTQCGDELPAELGKLEALLAAVRAAIGRGARWRRTLAGAAIGIAAGRLTVERAPPRRSRQRRSAETAAGSTC